MPKIMPVSDLRNYNEVLDQVAPGSPVYLTRNGRGRYAVVDIDDWDKEQALRRLMYELDKGRTSGEGVPLSEVRARFEAQRQGGEQDAV